MLTSKHGAGVSAAAWQRGRNTRNLLDGRCKAGPRPVYPTRITKKPQNYSGRAIECNLSLLNRARAPPFGRSEERRVGKEGVSTCRSRWSPYHKKKKQKS